ncbi:hypothetical protein PanWU01x14_165980 [Parasponia andersonii]|uniref:Uncharacterized protein n=1 Tax=Parasponia andersonii TaxID=3476 RepID=A0A2P5CC17_PARAD|nr:hypothetical protein PanWU01x14_165980 [Parasponia andersonii]
MDLEAHTPWEPPSSTHWDCTWYLCRNQGAERCIMEDFLLLK